MDIKEENPGLFPINTRSIRRVQGKHRELAYEKIVEAIEGIKDRQHKALFAFQYASGCRQAELSYVECMDLEEKPPLLWLSIYTVKNPDHPKRPFAINSDKEMWLYKPVKEWWEYCKETNKEKLFDIPLRTIRHYTKRYFGRSTTNHSLRHSRVTFFFRHNRNLNDARAMRLFGWKDRKSIARYDHLRREDIQDVFE